MEPVDILVLFRRERETGNIKSCRLFFDFVIANYVDGMRRHAAVIYIKKTSNTTPLVLLMAVPQNRRYVCDRKIPPRASYRECMTQTIQLDHLKSGTLRAGPQQRRTRLT